MKCGRNTLLLLKTSKKGLKFISLILATLAFILILSPRANAQTPGSYDVTISPVFFDLSANPGTTLSETIRVRNNTNSSLPIKVEVKKLTGDPQGNLTIVDNTDDDYLSWVKFPNKNVIARPLEWTNIPFTIDIPSSAAYGYYYAISLTQNNAEKTKTTGATINGAAAVPLLLNVRQNGAKAEIKVDKFSANSFINEYLPVDFTTVIENTGNVHVAPRGNIFISTGKDKPIATLDVNSGSSNVIPNTKKTFENSWEEGFLVRKPVMEDGVAKTDKNGHPVTKLTVNWDKLTDFRFGKYDANLILIYNDGQRDVPVESTVSFWVIPYKVIIGTIVFLVLFFLLVRFVLRKYVAGQVNKRR
jgi:hypothetical protein